MLEKLGIPKPRSVHRIGLLLAVTQTYELGRARDYRVEADKKADLSAADRIRRFAVGHESKARTNKQWLDFIHIFWR